MSHASLEGISEAEYKVILKPFFAEVSFTKSIESDPSIEKFVLERILDHGIPKERAIKLAIQAAGAAEWFYSQHPRDTKLVIALFTVYFTAIDDMGLEYLESIKNFRKNMMAGQCQPRLLQSFSMLLRGFDQHYDTFSADKITTGLISFMGSCAIESETQDQFHALKTAPGFPRYFRIMTGLAEPYAYFILRKDLCSPENRNLSIQAVPDIMDFTDTVNDILSFYKESILSPERNTFVYHRAKSEGKNIPQVLWDMTVETKQYIHNIEATLASNTQLSSVVDAYMRGYVGFHANQPRYKLNQLDMFT